MPKQKVAYVCQQCGNESTKWQGQCPDCHEWNSLVEFAPRKSKIEPTKGYSGGKSEVKTLKDVSLEDVSRFSTGMSEFDRVLGGGIVPGSVILLGGDPGIGKSSILLQVMTKLSQQYNALYVTGEESLEQVALRALRMGLPADQLKMMIETDVESIVEVAGKEKPMIMVIDSIQTMQLAEVQSAAGGVSQVRESAAYLTHFAKRNNCAIFLVGHVTKSGEVAGPRVLEHIVDAVIFIEGQNDGRYRVMRSLKNRFGAVNELGIFAMTEAGMKEVKNPSAIFLNRSEQEIAGSTIVSMWEGSRPLLAEVQALVDENHFGQPRRVCVGVDGNRIAMLLAVLHRHAKVNVGDQDVFINVVGGVKIIETSADLSIVLAISSSLRNRIIPKDWIIFGEVGLSGEIRPVPYGQERIQEAQKHGFTKAIIPFSNKPKRAVKGIEVVAVKTLLEAVEYI